MISYSIATGALVIIFIACLLWASIIDGDRGDLPFSAKLGLIALVLLAIVGIPGLFVEKVEINNKLPYNLCKQKC